LNIDVESQRARFPALEGKTYLNYGGQGVMATSTMDAVREAFDFVQKEGPFSAKTLKWIADQGEIVKESLASELGGQPDCYALVQNATEGCNIVLWGINWSPDDHVLTTDAEHSGVDAAVRNLAARQRLRVSKVSISSSSIDKSDDEIVAMFRDAIEDKTKLVVVSHVLWNTGRTLPLAEIQSACHEAGVQLLVDGAQSAGVIPMDFSKEPIDYYTVTGHKWIGAAEGVGALFIRRDLIPRLEKTFVGWRSSMNVAENAELVASRFEVATTSFPLWGSMPAAIQVHQQWGTAQNRFARQLENVRLLRAELERVGVVDFFSPESAPSGLVSFAVRARNRHAQIAAALEANAVMIRTVPFPDALRASVHYFTNDNDIRSLCEQIRAVI
jgi:L-cysteine/cystine lyase